MISIQWINESGTRRMTICDLETKGQEKKKTQTKTKGRSSQWKQTNKRKNERMNKIRKEKMIK